MHNITQLTECKLQQLLLPLTANYYCISM